MQIPSLLTLALLNSFIIVQAQNISPYWSLAGNSNTSNTSSKLGTTNAVNLRLYTRNSERMRIDTLGRIGIGTTVLSAQLQVNALSGNNPLKLLVNGSTRLLASGNGGLTVGNSTTPPSQGLYVAGNAGIGTATPVTKLEVKRTDGNYLITRFTNAATTGDRTALIDIQNGDNILWRYGVGGTGNGLGITNGEFYIERSGQGPVFSINKNGEVGIGTNNAYPYKLQIVHGSGAGLGIKNGQSGNTWEIVSAFANPGPLYLVNAGNLRGAFDANSGVYSALSDERLKTNINAMPSILDKINQLKPLTYQYKSAMAAAGKNGVEDYGFLAQEVMKVFPHLVTHHLNKDRDWDVYLLNYNGLGVLAIRAIQELSKKTGDLETLKKENAEMRGRIDKLEALVEKLANSSTTSVNITGGLEQASPNPASGITIIRYSVPERRTSARLAFTNAKGQTIKEISLTGYGRGQVSLNTTVLPSGVYTYTLWVDGRQADSKQLIIAK